MWRLNCTIVAQFAFERLFSSVDAEMLLKMWHLAKSLAAKVTLEGPFPCMQSHMLLKIWFPLERFSTICTLVLMFRSASFCTEWTNIDISVKTCFICCFCWSNWHGKRFIINFVDTCKRPIFLWTEVLWNSKNFSLSKKKKCSFSNGINT